MLLHPLELGSGAVDYPQPDGSTASVDEESISSELLSRGHYVNKVLPTASASDDSRLRDLEMPVDHGYVTQKNDARTKHVLNQHDPRLRLRRKRRIQLIFADLQSSGISIDIDCELFLDIINIRNAKRFTQP